MSAPNRQTRTETHSGWTTAEGGERAADKAGAATAAARLHSHGLVRAAPWLAGAATDGVGARQLSITSIAHRQATCALRHMLQYPERHATPPVLRQNGQNPPEIRTFVALTDSSTAEI